MTLLSGMYVHIGCVHGTFLREEETCAKAIRSTDTS